MTLNPWLSIPGAIYDSHMAAVGVKQLQALNQIMQKQIRDYSPHRLAICGVATGNGLEHTRDVGKVYGIDINPEYLEICRHRFDHMRNITFLLKDMSTDPLEITAIDLVIANLFVEYIDLAVFFEKIGACLKPNGTASIVIQKNPEKTAAISASQFSKPFEALTPIIQERNEFVTRRVAEEHGLIPVNSEYFGLPNGKSLIRIDVSKPR